MTRVIFQKNTGYCSQVIQPIEKDDILKLRKILRENSNYLTEYVENLCLFRMSFFGYIDKDKSYSQKLDEINDKFNQNKNINEKVKLPAEFEIVRNILLRIKEEPDFNMILKEVRSIA